MMKPVILLKDKTNEYNELFTSHGYEPFFLPVLSPIEFIDKVKLKQVHLCNLLSTFLDLFFKLELKPLLFLALSANLELRCLELLSFSFNSIVGLISPLKAPS